MKHKVKQLHERTIVCSKRKQKVQSVVSNNDNTKQIVENGIVHNSNLKLHSKGFENTERVQSNVSIIAVEHITSETERKVELNGQKPILTTSNSTFSSSNSSDGNKNDSNETIPNDYITETNTIKLDENLGNKKIECSERMSSPTSRNSRASHLSTILENVKGEEKAVKRLRSETKVQTDKVLNGDKKTTLTKKHDSSDTMLIGRTFNSHPALIPNGDAVIFKQTRKENELNKTDDQIKRQTNIPSLKSEKIVDSNIEVTKRPFSAQSDPGTSTPNSTYSMKSSSRRQKCYPGIRFTKQELEYYLPKRSNFNCHEKALKDAGLDIDAMESKRRQRLRRRAKVNIDDKEIDEKLKAIEDANAIQETQVSPEGDNETKLSTGGDKETTEKDEEDSEIERAKLEKLKRKGKKKGDETEIKVDHTVLLQYLKYVLENQDEYVTHKRHILQQNTSLLNIDPTCSIAKFGRIFQRGQHGTMNETFLLEVTRGIKSNFGESLQWVAPSKDKQIPTNMKVEPASYEPTTDEKDKTEYEKMKIKLDKWLKTVTTAQLLKAKELSLKELGEEDKLQSQWWSTLQPCRYLRQRSSLK